MALRNIVPTIALPFDKGIVIPGVTCTRSGTATYIDRYGKIQDAAANTPRITHGLDGVCKGLLCEPTSTNLNTYSAYLNGWTTFSTMSIAHITDTPYGSGANMGSRITVGATLNSAVYKDIIAGSTDLHTFSFIARGDGTLSFTGNGGTADVTLNLTDEWQYFSLTVAGNTTTGNRLAFNKRSGNTATFCDVTAIQFEPLPYATSLIKTTTASVTRNIDKNKYTLPSGYFTQKGTWIIEYDLLLLPGTSQMLLSIKRSDSDEKFYQSYLTAPSGGNIRAVTSFINNTLLVAAVGANPSLNTNVKTAVTYSSEQNDLTPQQKLFHAGTLIDTETIANVLKDTGGTVRNHDGILNLGHQGYGTDFPLCGTIKKVVYYPAVLTDSEILAL